VSYTPLGDLVVDNVLSETSPLVDASDSHDEEEEIIAI